MEAGVIPEQIRPINSMTNLTKTFNPRSHYELREMDFSFYP